MVMMMVTPLYCVLDSEIGVVSRVESSCLDTSNVVHMVVSGVFLPLFISMAVLFKFFVAPRSPTSRAFHAAPMTRIQTLYFIINIWTAGMSPFIGATSTINAAILLAVMVMLYAALSLVYIVYLPYYHRAANAFVRIIIDHVVSCYRLQRSPPR